MALKPTIYKFRIALSDLERDYYDTLALTVARHPSETAERMLVRVLAYCLNARDGLQFSRGLSEPDDPDLLCRRADGRIDDWIDVGEPAVERIRKATRLADSVRVYAFNTKATVWWQQEGAKLAALPADVWQLEWASVAALAEIIDRTTEMSITISDDAALCATDSADCEVRWRRLTAVR